MKQKKTLAAFVNAQAGKPHALVVVALGEKNRQIKIRAAYQGPVATVIMDRFRRDFDGMIVGEMVEGVYADLPDADGVIDVVQDRSGLIWTRAYRRVAEVRETLGGILPQQGDVTSRISGDGMIAGEDLTRAALRSGEGPIFDALAVGVAELNDRFPSGRRADEETRVLHDLPWLTGGF